MRAEELFGGCRVSEYDKDAEISSVCSDSRRVRNGGLFICLPGAHRDGHDYAADALEKGAAYVLAEHKIPGVPDDRLIIADSTRRAEAIIWNNITGKNADGMMKIAVTGTAGKTTVVFILAHILRAAGYRVGIVSTVKTMSGDRVLNLGEHGGSSVSDICGAMTTPDPEYFFTACAEMKKDGCEVLIIEASSQALAFGKLCPLTFDAAVFTNLSPEHLDCHGTMEEYFAAKAELMKQTRIAVINGDDGYMKRLGDMFPDVKTVTCSADPAMAAFSDVCALRYKSCGCDGIEYVYFSERAVFRVRTPLMGHYSVMNTMEAAACAVSLGVSLMTVKEALEDFPGADGRMTRIETGAGCPEVFIDYAHTAKSLGCALDALRESYPDKKLAVLFGCGGDRDRTKRPEMAKEAQRGADYVIITSDNCRSEDPDRIIGDILSGIDPWKPYTVIKDRREAVRYAVFSFDEEWVLLLAGKGHEKYEITRSEMIGFDESAIVREAVGEKMRTENFNQN